MEPKKYSLRQQHLGLGGVLTSRGQDVAFVYNSREYSHGVIKVKGSESSCND